MYNTNYVLFLLHAKKELPKIGNSICLQVEGVERFNLPKRWPKFRRVKRNKKLWPSKFFQKKPKTKAKRLPNLILALIVKGLDIMQKIVWPKHRGK